MQRRRECLGVLLETNVVAGKGNPLDAEFVGQRLSHAVDRCPGRRTSSSRRDAFPSTSPPPGGSLTPVNANVTPAARTSRRQRTQLLIAALVGAAGGLSCDLIFPSEEEIQREFQSFVDKSNQCKDVSECVVASTSCPLGCFVVVHRDHKKAVEDKARALVASYERGGRACAYECVPVGELSCSNNRCQAGPPP
jgi:hypothetical protein